MKRFGVKALARQTGDGVLNLWGMAVECLSFEWILTKLRRANGGDVILFRSFLISLLIAALIFLVKDAAPGLTLFGAIFAATYAALYARFSQQWHYLANLYNCIKTAEVRTAGQEQKRGIQTRLAQWKAGFIEDADTLHLANKPMIASIICAWAYEEQVRHWFNVYTIGGQPRLDLILKEAHESCERERKKRAHS